MDRLAAIRNKTQEVLARANELYGIDLKPTVLFNLRGRVAGWASCKICRLTKARSYTLRFNRDLVAGNHFEDMMNETVPHEVAHLVTYARPELGRNHDSGWRRICLALGGNGNTRHDYEVTYAHGGFTYRATCGTEVTVSKIIHSRIQAGQSRTLRKTGGRINNTCAWAPAGRPLVAPVVQRVAPVVQPKPVVQRVAPVVQPKPVVQPATDQTLARTVMNWVREGKSRGERPAAVANRLVNVFGIPRTNAENIVSKCWLTV